MARPKKVVEEVAAKKKGAKSKEAKKNNAKGAAAGKKPNAIAHDGLYPYKDVRTVMVSNKQRVEFVWDLTVHSNKEAANMLGGTKRLKQALDYYDAEYGRGEFRIAPLQPPNPTLGLPPIDFTKREEKKKLKNMKKSEKAKLKIKEKIKMRRAKQAEKLNAEMNENQQSTSNGATSNSLDGEDAESVVEYLDEVEYEDESESESEDERKFK